MSIICPECGASNPDSTTVCDACGCGLRPRTNFGRPSLGSPGRGRPSSSSRRDDRDDDREEVEDDRPRRRRRDEYDDEYDEDWRGGTPHRGGSVLTLGILGIICCAFCAPAAWIMGSSDLRQMREGRMDDSGRGTTQAGMILGIIGSILLILTIGFYTLAIITGGFN